MSLSLSCTHIHGQHSLVEQLQLEGDKLHEARDEGVPQGNCGNAQPERIPRSKITDNKVRAKVTEGEQLEEQNGLCGIKDSLGQEDTAINAIQPGHQAGHHRWHPQQPSDGAHIAPCGLHQFQFLLIGLQLILQQICVCCAQ